MNQGELTTAYPVVVVQDRYQGSYIRSHAGAEAKAEAWIAVANADQLMEGLPRAQWLLQSGPHGEDLEAMDFWETPPDWVATGATPTAAVENLLRTRR